MKLEYNFDKNLLKIINHYGVSNQLKHLQSEIWELNESVFQYEEQKSACEFIGCSKIHCQKEKECIAEELADVMVVLFQFKEYYHVDGKEILKIMNEKINRQIERIENGKR